ncbi:MAG: bifunctional diguanylate cyclase/phosphodiesterase [Gammaproteobacteria bacterium]|nr:bifunctional diguanylate cyclase/phosphodiesterase [Gammaproteobacteria bacterium]MCW5583095.1 bifunctional diguanylate cyclase/phosphodiesterase [Gammaproteobacteria bacterium]
MKIRSKTFIITGLISAIFISCTYFLAYQNTLTIISLTIIFFFTLFFSVLTLLIKPIEKLNQDMAREISANPLIKQTVNVRHLNEISSITNKFNRIMESIEAINDMNEKRINEITQEFHDKNRYLEQEISVQLRANKMIDKKFTQFEHHDNVTSLPNGIFFNEILNKAISYAKRRNQFLAVLIINLDAFKVVNETLGQENSNLVLKEMGKRFTNILRKEDVLAKLEGDEFIVLLSDISKPKFASMVAEKLLNVCLQLLMVDTHEFKLTASIGISIYPHDGNSLEELIKNADRALFKAKQAGGNNYQFYAEEIHVEALEYIQLESALRKAIHNNELVIYYQPKFRIKTGSIMGVESLMRWEHPVLGIVSPVKFIPLAEDSGLIMQIGEWALREACQRIKYWQNEGYEHVSIALKISPKQFHHPEIIKTIEKVFTHYNINPKYIELEIAEQTIMENIDLSSNILEKIKAIGVQISIDHFGKGYTSINYLKKFPISTIKIDRDYIKGIPNHPNDLAITSAIIALAHNLGLEVVAEGVETAEQIQFLSRHECDIVQGYFLGHPVSAQKIANQLKKIQESVLV